MENYYLDLKATNLYPKETNVSIGKRRSKMGIKIVKRKLILKDFLSFIKAINYKVRINKICEL